MGPEPIGALRDRTVHWSRIGTTGATSLTGFGRKWLVVELRGPTATARRQRPSMLLAQAGQLKGADVSLTISMPGMTRPSSTTLPASHRLSRGRVLPRSPPQSSVDPTSGMGAWDAFAICYTRP